MIEARELTKRYGDTTAVHSLSFTIAPGTVTGFLGPNGAGKSTTMRMIMGLDRPTSGTVTVNGKPYRQHRAPLREVGALLEASAVHPGRSARSHLRSTNIASRALGTPTPTNEDTRWTQIPAHSRTRPDLAGHTTRPLTLVPAGQRPCGAGACL
jgi:ABC-type cobalamin/Fe3+-siderophores transport system ATPase subunit